MKDLLKFVGINTDRIAAIVGVEELSIATSPKHNYNPQDLVLISIQSPEDIEDLSEHYDKFKDSLSIKFNDVRGPEMNLGRLLQPISDDVALTLLDFILKNKDEQFFIHCYGGTSRSAGVGIAIECILDNNGDADYVESDTSEIAKHWRYGPNKFVANSLVRLFNNKK